MKKNLEINDKKNKKEASFSTFGISKEKEYFIENFALLLSSGIDVVSAVDSMEKEMGSGAMKKIVASFKEDLESGVPLALALENTGIFPDFVFSLIRIGEKSGKLPENLQLIVVQQKKDRTFRSKIQTAVLYPVFVLVLALVIGVGISWYILPKLAAVFSQLNIKLPFVTRALIKFGVFMGEYGAIAAPVFLLFVFILVFFFFIFSKTKFIGQKILFHMPGIRRLIQEAELARMGFVFGILLEAGVPICESIKAVASSTSIRDYQKFYSFLAEKIEEGSTFNESFGACKKSRTLFPGSVVQIISAGEKSGRLSESLKRVGEIYEEKTENTTKHLATILEPILLVVVWLGVVFIALAVILPIYSLVGGFNADPAAAPPPPPPIIQPMETSPVGENAPEENSSENLGGEEKEQAPLEERIIIKKTETGFVNVRENGSRTSKLLGKVLPGETYVFLEEKEGWYRIKLSEEKEGWILGDYAQKEQAVFEADEDQMIGN